MWFFCSAVVNAMERTEVKINTISEQLGLSWAGERSDPCSTVSTGSTDLILCVSRVGPRAAFQRG